ncbi:PTS transporter subunit EIIC [[Mycoplasma] testudinis]|uniref:PTS transporter subunit EIIC n=1 Tax=[Mycoplasma] testudinis TaxID=33924 RepID=UPI000695D434|nr:PTS transporter subunit EIIC [[Mycoplasma] testudinis]
MQLKKHKGIKKTKKEKKVLKALQELGKNLIYPIAFLPFAAILNRLGSIGTSLAIPNSAGYWIGFIIQTPGKVVFDNLAAIFAMGVAFGFAKDNRGEAAIIGFFFYIILVAFTSENGLANLLYENVLVQKMQVTNQDSGSQVISYSQLIYLFNTQTQNKQYVLDIGIVGGITAGVIAAQIYNKFCNIKLHPALAFFGGRRFVPMMVGLSAIPVAFLFAVIWPWIQYVLVLFGQFLAEGAQVAVPGAFLYGVINRLMQPFGLHQILNTFLWFQLPIQGLLIQPITGNVLNPTTGAPLDSSTLATLSNMSREEIFSSQFTQPVFGDIRAFSNSPGPVATAALFQSGYFPIFMGGEPAAAFAMIMTVKNKKKRKEVATFFTGVALVAFLTGIDEPLVFSFLFLSPILWVMYAFLTGITAAIVIGLQVRIGFGFSGGFIDYAISFPNAWGLSNFIGTPLATKFGYWGGNEISRIMSNPLWMFPIAAISAMLFFGTFYPTIMLFDLKTMGRENETVTSKNFIRLRKWFKMSEYKKTEVIDGLKS